MSDGSTVTFQLPTHVSSLRYTHSRKLLVGSDDGSLRVYHPPDVRVVKAIRGLGDEVSSIALHRKPKGDEDEGRAWVACGTQAILFDYQAEKLVLTRSDALDTIVLSEDEDDVLNEIAVNSTGKTLAFSTDSGAVGVVDLASRRVRRMKTRHSNICGSVSFIPGRHNELVSGGYDSALLHFDFSLGNLSSRQDFSAAPQASGISLSPPFVLCLSVHTQGICAVGTADGHLWIGRGGEDRERGKSSSTKRKRWNGLAEDQAQMTRVADGPIVAVAFIECTQVLTCTLRGVLSCHNISASDSSGSFTVAPIWTTQVMGMEKVNALSVNLPHISVGGFNSQGKGLVVVLSRDAAPNNAVRED
ncbi:unnamed protein product [Peniophora sp. CBMAI 1063]|nr:unnamed protein product [Peniophora sp. CBMAI 1063]